MQNLITTADDGIFLDKYVFIELVDLAAAVAELTERHHRGDLPLNSVTSILDKKLGELCEEWGKQRGPNGD